MALLLDQPYFVLMGCVMNFWGVLWLFVVILADFIIIDY